MRFMPSAKSRQLMNHVKFDLDDSALNYPQRFGCGIRDINDPSRNERAAIVDSNHDRVPIDEVGHAHARAERQRRVRGGQFVRIVFFATRRLFVLGIEAGYSIFIGRTGPRAD